MKYATHKIEFDSQIDLAKQLWSLIDPQWNEKPTANGDAPSLRTTVGEGMDSPYRFGDKMRELARAEFAEIVSVNQKGYYTLGAGCDDISGSCLAIIAKPN